MLIPIDYAGQSEIGPLRLQQLGVFYKGSFVTVHLLNEGYLKKLLTGRG
jgi:hypothetical protein